MSTTIGPCKLEISTTIEVTPGENGNLVLASKTCIVLNGQPVGAVSRLRIDANCDEVVPAIEIDMLKGMRLDDLHPDLRVKAEETFEALRQVPGVKARMPAPRD
jgi:hypothetical protein